MSNPHYYKKLLSKSHDELNSAHESGLITKLTPLITQEFDRINNISHDGVNNTRLNNAKIDSVKDVKDIKAEYRIESVKNSGLDNILNNIIPSAIIKTESVSLKTIMKKIVRLQLTLVNQN